MLLFTLEEERDEMKISVVQGINWNGDRYRFMKMREK